MPDKRVRTAFILFELMIALGCLAVAIGGAWIGQFEYLGFLMPTTLGIFNAWLIASD